MRFYAGVPPDQVARLKRFRRTHSYEHLPVGNTNWEYIACGQGEQALLSLQVHTFHKTGHASSIIRREETVSVIRSFFNSVGQSGIELE